MKKKELKFIIPLAVVIILLVIVKLSEPEEIDWSYDFTMKGTVPYGGFIFHDIMPELFPGTEIVNKELPLYNVLKDQYYQNTNYVFVNSVFRPDELDTEYLLWYVGSGNNVFVSVFSIYGSLADSLQVETYGSFFNEDTININLTDPELKTTGGYTYKKGNFENYFVKYDTANTQVLGKNQRNDINFIRVKYGDGNFFLNTVPLAFTNYHLINENNSGYIFRALSYLPVQKTFWDDYYKAGNRFSSTPLRFIISQEALKLAYYLILAGIILFIIFYGRRKQRIIPIISPLKNTTLEFVRTVGNLYYQQKQHKNIAEKKITYFLDYIRNRYFIKSGLIDDEAIKKISEKTSYPVEKLKNIFSGIERAKNSPAISEQELVVINSQIETFYERTK